ncbi:HAD-IA family hydrolase [Methylobacterium nodulans]|uniref:HAD-superfamily hydrolase, subfamily IA, variant 3 n=1 Tax=Methylobacterium nodulans (strain LMG 21967 / CNCM I-2342 / ORS 2060) TaxID=460265 RepID=B8IAX4_METNO|nr:HAD-IA family hydrolase [Methylobacterium nodulans]ACL55367.1 HAD-superfamily hydrolase, subfamily IA, variant 3 [Methylobacterium nodulans ORS 2060]
MLKALIFDVDGTLAETEPVHRESFNRAFARFGLPFSWDEALYADLLQVTGGKERLLHYLAHYRPPGVEGIFPLLPEIYAAKTRAYVELVAAGRLVPRPGILRLVAEAKAAGLRLAIATTSHADNVAALIAALFRTGRGPFDLVAAGDAVTAKKPSPAVYDFALARLGVAATEAVAFEDSTNGVRAARAAGLPVVATPSQALPVDDLGEAPAIVSDLGEPGLPHRLLAGDPWPAGMVSVDALHGWHARQAAACPVEGMA